MAARSKRHIAGIRQLGESFPDTGINLFETGIAPYPNYTNLTFQPTREDTRFYQAGRDGEVEIEAFRLKNEELYRKDPLYQLRLNLLAPETNAIKALSNKSTREMMEEIMKSKYKKLLEEKKYFENVPERFHPLIRRILEQNKISPKEGDAVAQELDNAVRMGQVSDVMARQIRRMIESQTELTRQFGEQEEQRIISDLTTARQRILNNLRTDSRFRGKSEGYLEVLADYGLKDALDNLNAADLSRDLGRLVGSGTGAAINREIMNYERLRNINAEDVEETGEPIDDMTHGGAIEYPRTRNGDVGEFGDRTRGRRDEWAEGPDTTYGIPQPEGYRVRAGPSAGGVPDDRDDYTGIRTEEAPRSAAEVATRLNQMGDLASEMFRATPSGINPIEDVISIIESQVSGFEPPESGIRGRGGAVERRPVRPFTGNRRRAAPISMTETAEQKAREDFWINRGFRRKQDEFKR